MQASNPIRARVRAQRLSTKAQRSFSPTVTLLLGCSIWSARVTSIRGFRTQRTQSWKSAFPRSKVVLERWQSRADKPRCIWRSPASSARAITSSPPGPSTAVATISSSTHCPDSGLKLLSSTRVTSMHSARRFAQTLACCSVKHSGTPV